MNNSFLNKESVIEKDLDKTLNKEILINYIYEFASIYGQYYHNKNFEAIIEKVEEKIELPESFIDRLNLIK